jgi:hypothetical protein
MYVVEVGVDGIQGYIGLDGFDNAPLYPIGAREAFELTKNNGMVTHNHIATLGQGFVDNGFGEVETHQNTLY